MTERQLKGLGQREPLQRMRQMLLASAQPSRALILVIAAAAAACGNGRPSHGSQTGSNQADSIAAGAGHAAGDSARAGIDTSGAGGRVPASCDDLHYDILKVPATREAFAAEFGPPDSVAASAEPNRHIPGAVDSLFTVHYPGLVMDIRTPPDARDMATHVRVTDNRYLAYPGIGPGTAADRVVEVLGEPGERAEGYLRYQCSEGAEQPVTFRIAGGRVSAIEIDYYVD